MMSGCAQPSIRSFIVSRLSWAVLAATLAGAAALAPQRGVAEPRLADGMRIEVVATSVPRPAQLALTASGRLVVLSQGWRGDSAAEIFWLDPAAGVPINAALVPRVVIPFAEGPRKNALGSLAVHPKTDDLFLGEENGNRIYRFGSDKRLAPVVVGLNHLLGGSSFAIDAFGRLAVVDYASFESQLRSEAPPPPSLGWLATEDYQGPLVFRIDPDAGVPLPRRLELVPPIFPRPPVRKVAGEPLNKFIAVVARGAGELTLLTSVGEVFVLSTDGLLRRVTRLPSGHFNRTSMAVGPDGSVYVSAGFHIREVYRISPTGAVTSIAGGLGDPQGIAVDPTGALYIAETALHRIIRLR
jgi:DNA-binding beta-propeller fold protein YncE